ncbi:hypothetical protein [Lysinibacillus fusiformis]|uniref:hypothetical protein n=1 Tax=Lysinibacillus fusiformis TaxID=28031 RepID=UPI0023A9C552|nr:hypothetical protein [Lysinibacillus fusiformis]WEA41122.1 hypothetical protein PWJ66_09340 [Lysinibacillus fusiformis]
MANVKNTHLYKAAHWDWDDYYPYLTVSVKGSSLLCMAKMDRQYFIDRRYCTDSFYTEN